VFEVGAILQLFYPGNSVGCWYAGRTISGFGVGIATTIIPMYSAEMAPKHMRGQLGSLFQGCFTLGVFTSYWVTYGASIMTSSTHQWRIPVGLQLLFGGLLGLGMLFTKESTRWLAKVGRHEEALQSLVWVRGGEYDNEIQAEMDEIHAGIAEEERLTQGLVWKEYLLPANRWRIILVVTLQIGVQLTGNTSLAYFAPQFFAAVGAGDNSMLLSGFFGLCKVVACFVFLLFLVERIGRRWALLNGAFWMAILMLIVAVITATEPPTGKAGLTRSASAAIGMIYIEAMVYNISWGPVPCKCHVSFFRNRY
jgi:sugar porter (SP) family MFS transporter